MMKFLDVMYNDQIEVVSKKDEVNHPVTCQSLHKIKILNFSVLIPTLVYGRLNISVSINRRRNVGNLKTCITREFSRMLEKKGANVSLYHKNNKNSEQNIKNEDIKLRLQSGSVLEDDTSLESIW